MHSRQLRQQLKSGGLLSSTGCDSRHVKGFQDGASKCAESRSLTHSQVPSARGDPNSGFRMKWRNSLGEAGEVSSQRLKKRARARSFTYSGLTEQRLLK